jgi:hypothetical protein
MTRTADDPKNPKTVTIQLRVSPAYLRAVDKWRRHQPDIPVRSEAVRRLTVIALSKAALKAKAK